MPTFKIKPKTGLLIRDPETFELLSESGEDKPKISYWLNHLKMAMWSWSQKPPQKPKNSNKEQA